MTSLSKTKTKPLNGTKIETDDPCDKCGKRVLISKYPGTEYALYVANKERVCKTCAKKLRVI